MSPVVRWGKVKGFEAFQEGDGALVPGVYVGCRIPVIRQVQVKGGERPRFFGKIKILPGPYL
jgi:hypothetical protein